MTQYYVLKILESLLIHLSKRLCYLLASILGALAFGAVPFLRRNVTGNISHVLKPEDYNGKLNKTVRGVLTSTIRNYVDLVTLPHQNHDDIIRSVNVTGLAHLDEAMSKGKGAILCTAHLGCFDAAFQIFSTYPTQMTVVVEPINPPILLNYVTRIRKNLGINILPAVTGALRKIIKLLRNGEILLFALDRDTAGARVQSHFFGKETSMPAEALKIAMRTGAAIVPVFNNRRPDGNYNLYIEPEIDIIRNGNDSLEQNMERMARVLEKYISMFPEQWVVLEPIWEN
ncbi:lysophospholipid acyltransferase family protein [Chloroflexota bacterium]